MIVNPANGILCVVEAVNGIGICKMEFKRIITAHHFKNSSLIPTHVYMK